MGLFRTSDGIISQAMPLTAAMIASIDQRPAWLFENQSGTLGTNLNSSVIYCGTMPADGTGSISVILPGVSSTGVFSLQLTNGGTEYVTANNVATTSDTGNGSGLTLDIVATPAAFTGPVGGNGAYSTGAINTFVPALAGASGTIDSITTIGAPTALTLIQGGSGYDETLPYTYPTTVSPTGGTGLTISVTATASTPISFTGPTGGNAVYEPPNTPRELGSVTTFSPSGAFGFVSATDGSGPGGGGVPTAVTIQGGLGGYADGTVVEILQALDPNGPIPYDAFDIANTGTPANSNQVFLLSSLNNNYGVGNPVECHNVGSGSSNGKIPSGATIAFISADRKSFFMGASGNTSSALVRGVDEIAIKLTNGFGSTFTVVGAATGGITTFAVDNPGSGYNVGDVVSPTLVGTTFTGVSPNSTFPPCVGPIPPNSCALFTVSLQQNIQVGDFVTDGVGGVIPDGTKILAVYSQGPNAYFDIDQVTTGTLPANTTYTFTRVVGTPATLSVATLSTTGNPATVTLAGIDGYALGQEVEIQQTGAIGSKVTIVESDNPVVSATVGNNAGVNYSVGDVITIAQAGSDLNATLVVSKRALKPLVSQAITFTGLQSGSILPVSVDYVTAVGGGGVTIDNFIVGR